MKKLLALAIALSVCLTVTSCAEENSLPEDTSAVEQASETKRTEEPAISETETTFEAVTTKETTAAAETTVPKETEAEEATAKFEYMKNENLLLGFLAYLQKTEPSNGVHYVFDHGNSFDQYDFFYDFKIDGYSYQHRGDGSYNVRLTCSDSTCDLFPNGDSYWYFKPGFFCWYEEKDDIVTNTYEKYKDMPNYETINTAFGAACAFPFFEADEEWFKEVRTDISEFDIHNFYHTDNPYLDLTQYADGGVYPDDLRAAIKKLYNITLPENAFDRLRFESDGRVFASCGHGGSWMYEALVGYEETENEVRITVNFYGDEMYFYPVVQSEYAFSKNEDGNITLQRVEKNFDKGYELASGTV